jgi:hypothetical protein
VVVQDLISPISSTISLIIDSSNRWLAMALQRGEMDFHPLELEAIPIKGATTIKTLEIGWICSDLGRLPPS